MVATKVTLTLPKELLEVVDRYVEEHAGTTRSGVCAEALQEWLRAKQEAQITAYYRGMSEEEKADNAAWAGVATQSASRLWR